MSEELKGLDELIAALQIFRKYDNPVSPTHCEHDILLVSGIDPTEVSEEDTEKLKQMGFFVSEEYECFASFRYGSA